jgi:Spy/CpxP family protein refolding chaperone
MGFRELKILAPMRAMRPSLHVEFTTKGSHMGHKIRKSAVAFAIVIMLVTVASAQRRERRIAIPRLIVEVWALSSEAVQKELKLTDQQLTQLEPLIEESRPDLPRGWSKLPEPERSAAISEVRKKGHEANVKALAVLDDTQRARLKQLRYWIAAERVLLINEVADELMITSDQRAQFSVITMATADKLKETDNFPRGEDAQERIKRAQRFREIQRSAGPEYLKVLTADQKAQLEKLRGSAFDAEGLEFPAVMDKK